MHGISRKRLGFAVSITVVAAMLVVSSIASMLMTQQEASISLKQIIDNPEKYLGERFAVFLILNITLREDPHHRLIETYYLVHIKDSYGYETMFVTSSHDYSRYASCIGQRARFKLLGGRGPGLMHPPDRLITNILVSKSVDPYAREFTTIHISLADT
jgi:hypothetical protein